VELLYPIAADATAVAVLCVALSSPRRRRRELLVGCLGPAGARLKGNSSLRRVGADALNEAVGFDLLRVAGLAGQDAVSARLLANGGGARLRLARLKAALLQSGAASEALDTWTALLQDRATDLVDRDTIRSEARQVESYVDGHAVG